MPASWATSCRRRPGVRRREPSGSPTSAGRNRVRLLRRKAARSVRFGMPPACRTPAGRGWYRRSLPALRRPGHAGAMTTIALITGANKGIGFQTAKLFGASGMTVLVGARDEDRGRAAEQALRDGGADARFVALDVTDEKSV